MLPVVWLRWIVAWCVALTVATVFTGGIQVLLELREQPKGASESSGIRAHGSDFLDVLAKIEAAHSLVWNTSQSVVLLGAKVGRDFSVYEWAFQLHRYRLLHFKKPLAILPVGPLFSGRQTKSVAAIMCHSKVFSNCFYNQDAEDEPTSLTSKARPTRRSAY